MKEGCGRTQAAVTEMLGAQLPIFAFSHYGDVVAEVSGAGGFGSVGATAYTPEALTVNLD